MSNGPLPLSHPDGQGILHVLIVEDDLVDRRAVKRALKGAPLEVTVTEASRIT